MSYSLTQFENNTQNSLVALDNNIETLSAASQISCAIAGTNTLTLTQNAPGLVPSSPLSAYTQNMNFSGVATATNTGPVTATVGSIGALNVYKDTNAGPVLLSGQEIIQNCAISLRYDAALNSGAGGFHLTSSTNISNTPITPTSVQINGGATITNMLSGSVSISFASIAGGTSTDSTFTLTGLPPAIPIVGDFLSVIPPASVAIGLSWNAMVLSTGSLSSVASVSTLAVRMANCENVAEVPPAGYYKWRAMRTVP